VSVCETCFLYAKTSILISIGLAYGAGNDRKPV
jgi:hypothetical protein